MSSPGPPSRLPPDHVERIRTIATTVANGSQFGGTRTAKPVPHRAATPATPAPASGGILAVGLYSDFTVYTSAGAAFMSDSGSDQEYGDRSCFDVSSGGNVRILTEGVYSYSAWVQAAATGGCFVIASDGMFQPGYGYSSVTGTQFPTVTKAAFFVPAAYLPLPIGVTFGGAASSWRNAGMCITRHI